ncbi:TPA: uracil-xanthine permease family protein [Pseudomonas aeruginosa]
MHSEDQRPNDLIYGLDDRPRPLPAFLAALQHVLASFVGIVTPPLVIGSLLGLGEHLPYLISMALMVSGAGTLIQARRPFGIGAGMICLQGTSFAFLGAVLAAGMLVKQRGGGPEEILAMIFGVCFFGAFVQIVLSRFLGHLRRVITPLVTGIVITLIGVSLIKVGITDLGGGAGATDFGAPANLALGALVLLSIVLLNRSRLPWLRLAAIVIGLALGTLAAWATGLFVPRALPELPLVSLPQPFRFGFAFDWMAFLPVALIYLISSIETVGDLTANCMLSRQPLEGPAYLQRLRGGVLGDGVSCLLAATFSAFPNTTFAQNNGVIQLTGVASRYVGLWIAAMLVLLGLFPSVAGVIQAVPEPVLGGAAMVMFGAVAASGINILAGIQLDRRALLIIAVSLALGLGVSQVPEFLAHMPAALRNVLESGVATGGICALLLNWFLPESPAQKAAH